MDTNEKILVNSVVQNGIFVVILKITVIPHLLSPWEMSIRSGVVILKSSTVNARLVYPWYIWILNIDLE